MRKLLFVAILLACGAPASFAQNHDYPKTEVFVGYSHARLGDNGATDEINDGGHVNVNGFHTQISANVSRHFSLAGDVSGHYGRPVEGARASLYSFLAGPQLRARTGRATPFAHALFGVARGRGTLTINDPTLPNNFTFSQSETRFAFALGGGLDVSVSDHIALRLIQADYLQTHFGDARQNNLRLSIGIVFK